MTNYFFLRKGSALVGSRSDRRQAIKDKFRFVCDPGPTHRMAQEIGER